MRKRSTRPGRRPSAPTPISSIEACQNLFEVRGYSLRQATMPGGIGVNPVGQVELRIRGHALEQKGHEDDLARAGQLLEQQLEPAAVVATVAGWDLHPQQQDSSSGIKASLDDLIQVGTRLLDGQTPQAIVGAQLDNQHVGLLTQQPIDSGETACRRVTTDAGVDQSYRLSGIAPGGRPQRRERFILTQAVAGAQAVSKEDHQRPRRRVDLVGQGSPPRLRSLPGIGLGTTGCEHKTQDQVGKPPTVPPSHLGILAADRLTPMRLHATRLPFVLIAGLVWAGCSQGETPRLPAAPVILVGIDGASWNAIELLWQQGDLPHFRALAEDGVTAQIRPVAAASPVIWTSIATGVRPERHGITGFVVPTATGDVPVSSEARRVPAIWNMMSTVQRRVAVLGWWASWPVEEINGVVVSDRATRAVERAVWPAEFQATLARIAAEQSRQATASSHSSIARQDRVTAAVALELIPQAFDLLLVYFRNVDAESHPNWKYFQPQEFENVDPDRLVHLSERVPDAYRAVDRALGDLRAAAGPGTNIFVISDHGFRAVKREQYRIQLDLDRVLEHLGYLHRGPGGIDWGRTQAATWGSAPGLRVQKVRFGLADREPGGPVAAGDAAALAERLRADLSRVTYQSGQPAFRIRQPRNDAKERDADLIVVVRQSGATAGLEVEGEPVADAIGQLYEITGSHDAKTEGIFIAAGPDIDTESTVDRVHSLDITPTVLYALGLPIAQDFDGRPQTDLFARRFRQLHPVKTIPTWGTRESGSALASAVDEELLEELRALGYLD